jgi:protein O-GlcNAcase/histone acetyltransferase
VIEGFYGQPWTQAERLELLDWMAVWALNTYLYAPKDDLHQRAAWRELYPVQEAGKLKQLLQACHQRHLLFVYALSPGLDIRYADENDLEQLKKRFEQMLGLGCRHFSLLFDDIPDRMNAGDLERYGSLASAQCHVSNALFKWLRERSPDARLLFCPTAYCGRMAAQKLGGENYLPTLGGELLPEIDVLWTGPEIISREITVAHVHEMQKVLRRKPVIWDNLHANDYDGRRFFCGPYAGRPPELRNEVRGLLSNPNNELLLNYVPLHTLAEFVRGQKTWDARRAYLAAMREWLPRFATLGQPVSLEDLILFGDCYYLPHEEGPEAEFLFEGARILLAEKPANWGGEDVAFHRRAGRLRDFCAHIANLRHRPLFYALSRRVWELREELDLLEQYIRFKSGKKRRKGAFKSDSHWPGTYRGGMLPRLQQLLVLKPDGTFTATPRTRRSRTSAQTMNDCTIRAARPGDEPGAYYVCLKTGDYGQDGEPFYREDPDALGRIFVGPYLAYEPDLSLILEDAQGICGYALGALDSRAFYARYEAEWRPALCARFPAPQGEPSRRTRVEQIYDCYHHPDYFCPEPYAAYPSHLHIDLLPRAQRRGYGRRMLEQVMDQLRRRGSPGAHLGVSIPNVPAFGFYQRLGFRELCRVGSGNDGCIYMGKSLRG